MTSCVKAQTAMFKSHVSAKNLNPVVVCVRHNDFLLKTRTEAMSGVELAFALTQQTKLATDLHGVERPAREMGKS